MNAAGKALLAGQNVPWYQTRGRPSMAAGERLLVERVQTGVRMEKRLLKVLKALAEYNDLTLGDLLEGIVCMFLMGSAPSMHSLYNA